MTEVTLQMEVTFQIEFINPRELRKSTAASVFSPCADSISAFKLRVGERKAVHN